MAFFCKKRNLRINKLEGCDYCLYVAKKTQKAEENPSIDDEDEDNWHQTYGIIALG